MTQQKPGESSHLTTAMLTSVQHTVKTARRDARGVLVGTEERSWAELDRAVPLSVVAPIIAEQVDEATREAMKLVADAVADAAPRLIDAWIGRNVDALPEHEPYETAAAYFARVKAAIRSGHISATVFDLPSSYWDENESEDEAS